jgi:hypothetical protein
MPTGQQQLNYYISGQLADSTNWWTGLIPYLNAYNFETRAARANITPDLDS